MVYANLSMGKAGDKHFLGQSQQSTRQAPGQRETSSQKKSGWLLRANSNSCDLWFPHICICTHIYVNMGHKAKLAEQALQCSHSVFFYLFVCFNNTLALSIGRTCILGESCNREQLTLSNGMPANILTWNVRTSKLERGNKSLCPHRQVEDIISYFLPGDIRHRYWMLF